jgi:hypothetical protein
MCACVRATRSGRSEGKSTARAHLHAHHVHEAGMQRADARSFVSVADMVVRGEPLSRTSLACSISLMTCFSTTRNSFRDCSVWTAACCRRLFSSYVSASAPRCGSACRALSCARVHGAQARVRNRADRSSWLGGARSTERRTDRTSLSCCFRSSAACVASRSLSRTSSAVVLRSSSASVSSLPRLARAGHA